MIQVIQFPVVRACFKLSPFRVFDALKHLIPAMIGPIVETIKSDDQEIAVLIIRIAEYTVIHCLVDAFDRAITTVGRVGFQSCTYHHYIADRSVG